MMVGGADESFGRALWVTLAKFDSGADEFEADSRFYEDLHRSYNGLILVSLNCSSKLQVVLEKLQFFQNAF